MDFTAQDSKLMNDVGFSLIELLVAVSILTIISGIIIPNFNSYIVSQNLNNEVDHVISDLRAIQTNALAGTYASDDNKFWGIKFIPGRNNYFYFISEANTSSELNTHCTTVSEATEQVSRSTNLANNVVIKNTAPTCVFFSYDNGSAYVTNATGDIYLGFSTGDDCKVINVQDSGLATKESALINCP